MLWEQISYRASCNLGSFINLTCKTVLWYFTVVEGRSLPSNMQVKCFGFWRKDESGQRQVTHCYLDRINFCGNITIINNQIEKYVKPGANGRNNIVGCCMLRPFAHAVACCWMLLRVVVQSLKLKHCQKWNMRNGNWHFTSSKAFSITEKGLKWNKYIVLKSFASIGIHAILLSPLCCCSSKLNCNYS